MKRILATIMAVLALSTTMASAETVYILCTPGDIVNVRERATTRSDVVGHYECGMSFETDGVTKRVGGRTWVHMVDASLEVVEAWVCQDYVSGSEVCIKPETACVESTGRVAVRKSPGGKRVAWVRPGDDVQVIAYNDDWAITPKGYIAIEYLTFYGGVAQ